MVECWLTNEVIVGWDIWHIVPALSKEFGETQATIEGWLILKRVRGIIKSYTDKYSKHRPIIFWIWQNGYVLA